MPIFRIMGGAPSRSSQYPGNRTSENRNTYPAQRTSRETPVMPSVPPTTGAMVAGGALAAGGAVAAGSNVVVQGSNVGSSPTNPVAGRPPSSNANNSRPGNNSNEPTRPGAYAVTRSSQGPAQVYRVTVPAGVTPGSEFTVHAGPRRVRVRCPNTSRPGQALQITLPPEAVTHHSPLRMAPLTAAEGTGGGGAALMTEEVRTVNRNASESGATAQTFLVTIPPNIYPGMEFTVSVHGQRFVVTCPSNAGPNMKVRIVPPTQPEQPVAAPKMQVFEVAVPPGVQPKQQFALVANGQRVLVTCPPNVSVGQKIRFQLPVQQMLGHIQLNYENATGGWCRTIRVTDLKFQWVRVNGKQDSGTSAKDDFQNSSTILDVGDMDKFDFKKSAYCRKLSFLEGNDARMRTGLVELVPAKDAVVDSKLVENNNTLVQYSDIASVQGKTLEEKTQWFQNICSQITGAWEAGHIKISIRRKYLLLDSVDAIMSLGRDDLRKRWRFEFLGEPGIDSGGVTREWFQLVTEQIFDPAFGLWKCSTNNQACVTINPDSAISCPDDHLVYFRFLGRVIGRALFDRQLIKGHMVRHLYKHLLGWPITFEDLFNQDPEYYQSLKKLLQMDDVSCMCLDFTYTEESMGARTEVELVKDGALMEVTNDNIVEYLEANLRYQMMERTKLQLTEILLGFFDIIPEPPLTVFDSNELELILCGLPTIDMDDWENNTIYSGTFESKGRQHKVVRWFWETVREDFDTEMKARLLQFVTGTSGVPARGFSVLQGNDGNIKNFAIYGMEETAGMYPRAHTCFNRIDLPVFKSKKELYEKLKISITLSGVGFDMD